jgi:threonine aldolase
VIPLIDLRSDTVTKPSPEMRRAMAEAEVGDDVFGDDPTVQRLEEMAAAETGKEAALFVASGTMGNLVALLTHCRRGDEVIAGNESHVLNYEVAGAAAVAGVQLRAAHNTPAGDLDDGEILSLIRGSNVHYPETRLLCLEDTHNRCGGAILPPERLEALAGLAHENGLQVHVDGARIHNAAVALGRPVSDFARHADSVDFCFSKGLGAPVGSVICGSEEFIGRARKNRKMVGGGMRQVGILAAAAIYALENMVDRLAEDHANARLLWQGLAANELFETSPQPPDTNIVICGLRAAAPERVAARIRDAGVLFTDMGAGRMRFVTHYGIDEGDVRQALDRIEEAVAAAV